MRPASARLGWLYAVAGAVGLVAAVTLLVEKLKLLEDPTYVPSCSINPILSCGSIMRTWQAEAFGFPNPIIGIAAFAAVSTIGVAALAGASFHPWFWRGLLGGTVLGTAFVHWLIFQSLYRIGALCPYCMAVWAVTIPLFWYTALEQFDRLRTGRARPRAPLLRLASEYHLVVLTTWYLAIGGLIAHRFWDYWSTLLT